LYKGVWPPLPRRLQLARPPEKRGRRAGDGYVALVKGREEREDIWGYESVLFRQSHLYHSSQATVQKTQIELRKNEN
jgi:hypothetical protein